MVTAPIIGPRTPAQLDNALKTIDIDIDIDTATLGRIDELFPGHHTAPEDYAWQGVIGQASARV